MTRRPGPWTRRQFGRLSLAAAGVAAAPAVLGKARQQVIVVGGGAGGTTAARELAAGYPELDITLIEQRPRYLTPFFANRFLGGLSQLAPFVHDYSGIADRGRVRLIHARVESVDAEKRRLSLTDGSVVEFDRLILSPGVSTRPGMIGGYDEEAAEILPHAYVGNGESQWRLLKSQLDAMEDGGVFAISVPKRPYRCHPAPYERASLIANYLKRRKPRSKVLILDANVSFPLMDPMMEYWEVNFGELIEWISADFGGAVAAVDAKSRTLKTEDEEISADVANVIPPQRARDLALRAGLTDKHEWCPVDPGTFQSSIANGIYVLGDAIDPGDMPRSAFAANSQAKVCAIALGNILTGRNRPMPSLTNACYFLLEKDAGLVVGGAYKPDSGRITGVKGYASEAGESEEVRKITAAAARDWYAAITKEMFG